MATVMNCSTVHKTIDNYNAHEYAKIPRAIDVRLVSSHEERQMIVAVRASVYLNEKDARYNDHFDDNDHCSSLFLALLSDEPVGTLRCRWFADIARIEKLAIRKQYRSLAILNALTDAALRLAVKKGYRLISGIALEGIVPFWMRKGGFAPGKPFDMVYGTVVPMIGSPPDYPDIDPICVDQVGNEEFERRMYQWEGADL